ncbi:hypothetical protein EYF80_036907 [Liparis tanakae]|uniref:Uncharacterized protein n=1 Tax=Liparis tanakae TaxID=230148 RepID=A0A4Z2GJB6_9TELE|nr:hypothetical protein EYF80_036907 [Liparis tanakae]
MDGWTDRRTMQREEEWSGVRPGHFRRFSDLAGPNDEGEKEEEKAVAPLETRKGSQRGMLLDIESHCRLLLGNQSPSAPILIHFAVVLMLDDVGHPNREEITLENNPCCRGDGAAVASGRRRATGNDIAHVDETNVEECRVRFKREDVRPDKEISDDHVTSFASDLA